MESSIYHLRAKGVAEKAVHAALQAWSTNLHASLGAFLQRTMMTHPNTSKRRSKTPVELLLACKMRLPEVADFGLSKPPILRANEKNEDSTGNLHKQEGLEDTFYTT